VFVSCVIKHLIDESQIIYSDLTVSQVISRNIRKEQDRKYFSSIKN